LDYGEECSFSQNSSANSAIAFSLPLKLPFYFNICAASEKVLKILTTEGLTENIERRGFSSAHLKSTVVVLCNYCL
jgi:hypothetical protein